MIISLHDDALELVQAHFGEALNLILRQLDGFDLIVEVRPPSHGEFVGLMFDTALGVSREAFLVLMDLSPSLLERGWTVEVHRAAGFDLETYPGDVLAPRWDDDEHVQSVPFVPGEDDEAFGL